MKCMHTALSLMAAMQSCQAFMPVQGPLSISSFSGAPTALQYKPQQQHTALSMTGGDQEHTPWQNIAKSLATFTAALAIMTGGAGESIAARSGGRMGGRSFSSPSRSYSAPRSAPTMRSAPSRSYSAPSRSRSDYEGSFGGGSRTIIRERSYMPMPLIVPSPFGYGGGFGGGYGYGGGTNIQINPGTTEGGQVVVQRNTGPNPLTILLVGGAVVTAAQIFAANRASSGDWGAADENSSLGAGVGVVKLQICLTSSDRSRSSILGQLGALAESSNTNTKTGISKIVSETCVALLRKSADWNSAALQFEYYPQRSAEKAEATFSQFAIQERLKVERETVSRFGGDNLAESRQAAEMRPELIGRPTQAVVTLVVALRGDTLKWCEQRVPKAATVTSILQQLAGDATTDGGENVMAAEVLWTPEEPWEVLDKSDVITDFPELRDL